MKIVESNYYPDGFSNVILEHQGKQYEGKSFYNKDEKNPPSPFFGQRLAEKRAIIEIWKEKRDINRIKRQALKSLRKDIEKTLLDKNIPYGEREEIIIKILDNHIKYYDKETKDYKEAIKIQKKNIQKDIELRQKLLDRINKGKNK